MCLITFLPPHTAPDDAALAAGARANPHGHGYAIVSGDRLLLERGLDAAQMIDRFLRARRAHPDGPAVFHSRLATHGRISTANCHPFAVGGDARTVLAHNGILPAAVWPPRRSRRSDTRIAAEQYLPTLGSLRQARVRRRVERWMGPGNKMVILTVDPTYRQTAYLLNEQAGFWSEGIWYSNLDFDGAHNRWRDWTIERVGECVCGAVLLAQDLFCLHCARCVLCAAGPDTCQCWETDSDTAHHPQRNGFLIEPS